MVHALTLWTKFIWYIITFCRLCLVVFSMTHAVVCVVFSLVFCEVGRVLEQGDGVQQEETSHLDQFA